MALPKTVKVVLVVLVAIATGLLLSMIVPTMEEGTYDGKIIIRGTDGMEYPIIFTFDIGAKAKNVTIEQVLTINGKPVKVTISVPAVKTLKLGAKLTATAVVNDTSVVELSKTLFVVTSPARASLTYMTYIPIEVKDTKVLFSSTILYKTKEAAFVFGSAVVLFIGASIIPYVITSIYSTLALFLLGALTLSDPFTLYMSDTCLVFLAGSAFELVLVNTGLANRIASALRSLASSPSRLFVGTFVLSGFISWWMSNTSATYLFLPIVSAIAAQAAIEDTRLYELVLVGLASGATCGGMATVIGTPPNLIGAGFINSNLYGGKSIVTFSNWLLWGLPLFLIGTVLAYITFRLMYAVMGKAEADLVTMKLREFSKKREPGKKWSNYEIVGLATVLFLVSLWVTESIHGIKTGVAGMIGLLVFLATGVLKVKQIKDLSWDIVILMGAGLTLGKVLMDTGFSAWLSQAFTQMLDQPVALLWLIGFVSMLLGMVISSHTSAAAFIAPIMAPIGTIIAAGMGLPSARLGAAATIIIAVNCVNWAIALPISTPPSAIVFGTGKVQVKTLAMFGIIWGVIGTILTLLIAPQIVYSILPP